MRKQSNYSFDDLIYELKIKKGQFWILVNVWNAPPGARSRLFGHNCDFWLDLLTSQIKVKAKLVKLKGKLSCQDPLYHRESNFTQDKELIPDNVRISAANDLYLAMEQWKACTEIV